MGLSSTSPRRAKPRLLTCIWLPLAVYPSVGALNPGTRRPCLRVPADLAYLQQREAPQPVHLHDGTRYALVELERPFDIGDVQGGAFENEKAFTEPSQSQWVSEPSRRRCWHPFVLYCGSSPSFK